MVVGDSVGFIDVRKHDDQDLFSDQALMRIVANNWPDYIDRFHLKGILPSNNSYSNNEIAELRKSGITPMLEIDGKVYAPAGITSASTSSLVSMQANNIIRWIRTLAEMVEETEGQYLTTTKSLGIDDPIFSLKLTPKGLAIFEEKSNVAFTFSKFSAHKTAAWLNDTARLMFPEWALQHLLDNIAKQN